eukprot:6189669-Pleurochrysis_carterae.AAC.1
MAWPARPRYPHAVVRAAHAAWSAAPSLPRVGTPALRTQRSLSCSGLTRAHSGWEQALSCL